MQKILSVSYFYLCLGVTKRRRLSRLTNNVHIYESKCGGEGDAAPQPISTAVHT
jgi:hypothetical protein